MHLRGPATTSSLPESATRTVCFQLFTCRKLWVCVCAPAAHATTDCPCTSLVFCSRLWVCIMLEVVKHPMTQSTWVACRSLLILSFAKNGGAPHTAVSNCHDTANSEHAARQVYARRQRTGRPRIANSWTSSPALVPHTAWTISWPSWRTLWASTEDSHKQRRASSRCKVRVLPHKSDEEPVLLEKTVPFDIH